MDLSELPDREFLRHPWELARARFFAGELRRSGLLSGPQRLLDVGAGDGWFAPVHAAPSESRLRIVREIELPAPPVGNLFRTANFISVLTADGNLTSFYPDQDGSDGMVDTGVENAVAATACGSVVLIQAPDGRLLPFPIPTTSVREPLPISSYGGQVPPEEGDR